MNTEVNAKALLALLNQRELPEFKTLPEVCDFVTNFLMKKYDLRYPSDINWGYCFIWAYLVWALWKKPLNFVSCDGHIVIEYEGLYYDSTSSHGCDDLESMQVNLDEAATLGVKGMAWYWTRCGTYKDEFRKILRATHMKLYKVVAKGGLNKYDSDDLHVEDVPYPSFV